MSNVIVKYHNISVESALKNNSEYVLEVAKLIDDYKIDGFEFLSFKDIIYGYDKKNFKKIFNEANKILDANIENILILCPVIVKTQIKMAIDFLTNKNAIEKPINTFFICEGDSLDKVYDIFNKLNDKKFIIFNILFSKNNFQNIIFNIFNNSLISSQGKYNSKKYIYFGIKTSDRENFYFAKYNKFNTLVINEKFTENFSFFSYPILFILAIYRINVEEIIKSAVEADIEFNERDTDFNELLKYICVLRMLNKNVISIGFFEKKQESVSKFITLMFFNVVKKVAINSSYSDILTTSFHNTTMLNHFTSFQNKLYDYDIYDDIYNEDNLANIKTLSLNNIQQIIKDSILEIKGNFGNTPIVEFVLKDSSSKTLSHLVIFIQKLTLFLRYLDNKNPFF
ncbi:hypothetical protein [Mycoplasma elephantis]|uniref:hypothetical protein n=1 Tax=Mycoplasma elephantis TaxID=114882 RepID=UPI0004870DB0|nr:hypothetical protein [Mycoplasma elephantis]